MKRSLQSIILLIFFIALMGCNKTKIDPQIESAAKQIIDIFEAGDIEQIESFVFHKSKLIIDDELAKEFDINLESDPNKESQGVLSIVFSKVKIEIKEINDTTVTYEIKAPDLSNFFSEEQVSLSNASEGEFLEILRLFVNDAKIMKKTVSMEYTKNNGFTANYTNEDFIDAITGGLLRGYAELYQNILSEFGKGLDE